MTSPDMTIRDVRVTMLRVPWADDPWLKGAALGAARDILVCDVETVRRHHRHGLSVSVPPRA